MAHELAHVKHRDILISTVSATMAGAIGMLANFGMMCLPRKPGPGRRPARRAGDPGRPVDRRLPAPPHHRPRRAPAAPRPPGETGAGRRADGRDRAWPRRRRLVVAVGACACSGGVFRQSPVQAGGLPGVPEIPVDLWIAGCPPHPITVLDGLLRLLGRLEGEGPGAAPTGVLEPDSPSIRPVRAG